MKINYQETARDLLTRIDIHTRYGARDIDQWTVELLHPAPDARILDVGCGAGKQCFLFYDHTRGKADINGGDFSDELIARAEQEREKRGAKIRFMHLDFNQRFPFDDNGFDLVTSAFAIYYASDLKFTFSEARRVLVPGGHLFVSGPLPANKQMFYDIIREASGKAIPPMPGSSRFEGEIFATIQGLFAHTEMHVFENPITFPSVAPFIEYTRASLSEDRKLWTGMFNGKDEYEALIQSIQAVAEHWFQRDGKLVMTKVVGGILATR
jgi:ubiquinone/menaquinone biosynthesis C-methylase UbiE